MSANKHYANNKSFIRLSHTAIDLMNKILLLTTGHYETFATSTVPISNWLTHDYYVYSCLLANRCHKLTRILLSDTNLQQIRANNEDRIHLMTLVQAHEVCTFDCILIVFDRFYRGLQNNGKGFFTNKEDLEYFLNSKEQDVDKHKFDFFFVPQIRNLDGVVIKPIFPASGGDVVDIEVFVASEKLEQELKNSAAKYSVDDRAIHVNEKMYSRYENLYRFLNSFHQLSDDILPLRSKLLLA